ncbi:MAG: glycine cleavage system protein GcvH [Gammaproteobacteria bacterium]|nr:MAG: glycine cleavage system protein GcvH [Gammaproteobacteria bacterium]
MSQVPAELKYVKSHEWVQQMEDGSVRVGITDHAQELLGDLVFVELPEVGTRVEAGQDCAVVESVKAASDVYAPISGEVVEVNSDLENEPEGINENAYDAWMFRLQPADLSELDNLLDADAYSELLATEG